MSEKSVYLLEILFNGSQIPQSELEESCKAILPPVSPRAFFEIVPEGPKNFLLRAKGSLEDLDTIHAEINENIIRRRELTCVRLTDEAGDKIRQEAYPILARIEQRFRSFINRATLEIFGFNWWNDSAPPSLKAKVLQTRTRDKEDGVTLHPLEYTQFDDLVELVTAEVSEWSADRPLAVHDLLEIFSGSTSIAEAKSRLEAKTRKISYWDDVFARYFHDRKEWERTRDDINFVIRQRHKVMHHRPIRLGIVRGLKEHESKLDTLFESAKPSLSVSEITEAQEEAKHIQGAMLSSPDLVRTVAESFQTLAESPAYFNAISPIQHMQETLKTLTESPAYFNAISPIQHMQETLKTLTESPAYFNAISPIQHMQETLKTLTESPAYFNAISSIQHMQETLKTLTESPAYFNAISPIQHMQETLKTLTESPAYFNAISPIQHMQETLKTLTESPAYLNAISPIQHMQETLKTLTESPAYFNAISPIQQMQETLKTLARSPAFWPLTKQERQPLIENKETSSMQIDGSKAGSAAIETDTSIPESEENKH